MNTRDVLNAVRVRLTPRGAWCKGVSACLPDGKVTYTTDPRAQSWCLLGALYCETGGNELFMSAVQTLREPLRGSLATFNDRSTHAAMLSFIDAAIERTS